MRNNPDQGRRGGPARKCRSNQVRETFQQARWQTRWRIPPRNRPGGPKPKLKFAPVPDSTATMRLNRYIAQAGICSRREADVMSPGNNKVVTELGFKVDPTQDLVRVQGDTIRPETMRYVLVNKPKNFLGIEHDLRRRTVGDLIKKACRSASSRWTASKRRAPDSSCSPTMGNSRKGSTNSKCRCESCTTSRWPKGHA